MEVWRNKPTVCGSSPIQAFSGKVTRHRLNRGGDRSANHALWRIVMVRLQYDADTRAYVARRTKGGKSKREIMRCLKRYVARGSTRYWSKSPLDITRSFNTLSVRCELC